MAATYYLTVIPETSRVYDGIRRAAKAADNITVHPKVDQRQAERDGRSYGDRFKRGFSSAAAGIGAGLGGVTSGFKLAGNAASTVVRHVGLAATTIGIAAKLARGFSATLLASATALRLVAGVSLGKLAGTLALVAGIAGRLARQVQRVTSAILVLAVVGKVLGFMQRAAKMMALLTIGASLLIGIGSALAVTLGNVLVAALMSVGAAMSVAAGAAAGLLGPALIVAKLGFKGLADGAKEFNGQFADADKAFNQMIGERMGPLLKSFRDLKQEITGNFSKALSDPFVWLGGALDGIRPKIGGLATTLGNLGGEVAGTLNNLASQGVFDKLIGASDRFFQNFLGESGVAGLTGGLVEFAATAADTFAGTGKGINDALLKAGEWLRGVGPAQMKLVFATITAQIKNIMAVLGPVINGIRQIGGVTAPALAPGFKAIGAAIEQAVPGLVQMAQILMPALSQVMERLAPVLPALVAAFTPWAGTLATIAPPIASIVANLAPLAPLLLVTVGAFKAIAVAMALYNTVMLAITNAGRIATAVQWLWNAALTANPIGIVVVAVAALAAGLWAFFTKTETGRQLWDKIWTAIKTTASTAWEWIKQAFSTAWAAIGPVLQRIGEVASTVFGAIGDVISWLWHNVVVPAFDAISAVVSVWWAAAQVVFAAAGAAIRVVGEVISWLWQNVATPAFNAIGGAISAFWSTAQPIWDLFKVAIDAIGEKVGVFKDVLVTAFNKVRDVISGMWDKVGGIFDKVKNGLGAVKDFFNSIGGGDGPTVNLNGGATGGYVNGGSVLPGYANGGQIRGPGTGTSDSILGFPAMVRVANGEFVTNAQATGRYLPLLQAINAGMPLSDVLASLLPRFAEGGLVSADDLVEFARGVDGKPYVRGGVNWGDCSGAVSAIANYATGRDPFGSRFATMTEGDELAARGFKPGLGPAGSLSIGWYNGGPGGGHTAATLPDGTHFEMGGAAGNGQFGGSAVGADASEFTNRMHLPPEAFTGLDGDGTTVGSSTSARSGTYSAATSAQLSASSNKVSSAQTSAKNADQAVDDATYRKQKADQRLADAKAKGKGVEDAQHSADVADRELNDAKERQTKAHDKLTEATNADTELRTKGKFKEGSASSSKDGGLTGADFGKTFVSGVLESIGLDGSLFSNPLEWPTVKSLMAGVNFAGGLLSGGASDEVGGATSPGGFAGGAADAVGLGGLLTALAPGERNPAGDADANWTAQSGSPALAPGQFNPAVSGSSTLAEAAVGAMSAFAPDTTQHGQAQGAAPGPQGDVVFSGNVGMDPAALRGEFRNELNGRRRYT
ncbi:endolysin [Mycobacterium phage SirPhilip]|uniref:Tape measure protein n=1 Tax=Mycobacterium phage SirPhilip TaxID=2015824 RepID=A0A222ZLQ0_9CAUD|nr:endolysin [Mycobacterium phage SirPhilip]ASR85222.1 tape measure protein [Mycobacterium phage SirPhilip]